MNLSIILPALLMAAAALIGIAVLAIRNAVLQETNVLLYKSAEQTKAYNAQLRDLEKQNRDEARAKIETLQQRVADLTKQLPSYGRDAKTGKFVKRSA